MFKSEKKAPEPQEPPEQSVPLRVVVFLMALLCVGATCYFSKLEPLLSGIYILTVVTGSYLSYLFRNDDSKWLRRTAFIGIVLVGIYAGRKFISPLTTEYDFVAPFVIFLAGVFASLCFEMRSRSDLNLSSGLGLLLLCVTAPVARGLLYGGLIIAYILLGAVMLYYDCVSRTLNAWLKKQIDPAPQVNYSGGNKRMRSRVGSTLGLIAFMPLLALMMFLFMPRVDSFIDQLMAYSKSLNPDYVLDMVAPSQKPARRNDAGKGQSARDWFKKNSDVLSNLKKNQDRDKDMEEKLKATADKADKKPQAKESSKTSEKKPPEKKPADKKSEEKKKKEEEKDQIKNEPKDKKKVESGKKGDQSEKSDKADNADKKSKKKQKSKNKDKKSSDKSKAKGKKGGAGAGDKSKKGKGSGTAGKGAGKTGSGGGDGGSGGKKNSGEITIKDEKTLDTRAPFAPSNSLVVSVKSRRLTYMRRQCYDRFNGVVWSDSTSSKSKSGKSKKPEPEKSVKVVDGVVKRDSIKDAMEKAAIARTRANQAQSNIPMPQAPTGAVSPGSILMKGGTLKKQEGLVMNAGSGKSANTQSQVEPQKVESESQRKEPFRDLSTNLSKARKFEFLSRERPLFLVGMADAFSIPPRYPSISITQEIEVKAKSLGKVMPGAWIPQEVILDQKEMSVDGLGVMRTTDSLKNGTKFKVKTELPIFNLAYMRQRSPLGADQEELIRDNFSRYLQLPSTITDSVFETAETNTSPEFNWYVQSEQIAEYLRKNYEFNPETVYDDKEPDVVSAFLNGSEGGQATHFASAFVILNRCIGIPCRLVTGFAPGELNRMTGARDVSGLDSHTWAESYIPEFGWVPFDATPEGFLPAQKRETEYTADDIKEDLGLNEAEKKKQLEQALNIAGWILGVLVALALLALLLRKLIPRLLAWYRSRRARGPEWGQYKKVVKSVKESTGVNRYPQETPSEFTFRVRQTVDRLSREGEPTPSGLPDSLDQFMHLYSDIYFGQKNEGMDDLKYYADLVATHAKNRK